MITIIALVIRVLMALVIPSHSDVVVIPPMPNYSPSIAETAHDICDDGFFDKCLCDDCCHAIAVQEYVDEFTALFNSYEVKRAKNGALMIRRGSTGSYKFAKKG